MTSEEASEISLQGEAAMSLPNPNTKDEIYIDDMEGVEDSRDLTITRALWQRASEPIGPVTVENDFDRTLIPRLPFNWYNPDNVVRRKEVFPELTGQQEGEDFLQVLEFTVRDEEGANDPARWMGVMRNLSPTGEDFSEKKFLEIWVNDFQRRQGKMLFDMGEVSEDYYLETNSTLLNKGRGKLDTEDTVPVGGDGILNKPLEDFGLDNILGDDDAALAGDDGNDDFFFEKSGDPIDYTQINNPEDNNFLDTEDLDGDRALDLDNIYFSYVLDLADSIMVNGLLIPNPAIVQDNSVVSPGNGWRLFQIPLDSGISVTQGALPRRLSVKYARLWFDQLPTGPGVKIQIASLKIAGAAWREEKFSTNDTGVAVDEPSNALLTIKDVNNKEDPVYAGQEPFDPGEDSSGLKRREQSLIIDYRGIPSSAVIPGGIGRQGSAYREILDTGDGKNQDFTQYEDLSFYLRDGQRIMHKTDRPDTSQGTFFFRFGPDTTNFYEFSTKMDSRWENWDEVFLRLNDLAELKLDPAETTRTVEGIQVPYRYRIVEGDTLAVYGAPSLTRVRRMTVGVRGDDPFTATGSVSGVVWFNEIRLRAVKKEPGYASRANGNARFADFATVNGSIRKVDSEFRGIDGERLGDDQLSWSIRGDMQMHKFVDGRGLSLPFSASYSDSRSIPRLAPNSDIELEDENDRVSAQSRTRSWDVSGRFSKVRPSTSAWLRYTLDNFALSASNRHEKSSSTYQKTEGEGSTALATYNLNPGTGKTFRLLQRFDISYFPTLKLAMTGNINILNQTDIVQDTTGTSALIPRLPIRSRQLKSSIGTVWDPIRSNSFDSQLTFNKTQDLDLHKTEALWESFKLGGREETRDHTARFSWHPTRVRWLRPVFTYTSRYGEDQTQSAQDPNTTARLRNVQNGSTREVSATFSFRQLLPKKGDTPTRRATKGRTDPPRVGADETQPPEEERETEPRDEDRARRRAGCAARGRPAQRPAGRSRAWGRATPSTRWRGNSPRGFGAGAAQRSTRIAQLEHDRLQVRGDLRCVRGHPRLLSGHPGLALRTVGRSSGLGLPTRLHAHRSRPEDPRSTGRRRRPLEQLVGNEDRHHVPTGVVVLHRRRLRPQHRSLRAESGEEQDRGRDLSGSFAEPGRSRAAAVPQEDGEDVGAELRLSPADSLFRQASSARSARAAGNALVRHEVGPQGVLSAHFLEHQLEFRHQHDALVQPHRRDDAESLPRRIDHHGGEPGVPLERALQLLRPARDVGARKADSFPQRHDAESRHREDHRPGDEQDRRILCVVGPQELAVHGHQAARHVQLLEEDSRKPRSQLRSDQGFHPRADRSDDLDRGRSAHQVLTIRENDRCGSERSRRCSRNGRGWPRCSRRRWRLAPRRAAAGSGRSTRSAPFAIWKRRLRSAPVPPVARGTRAARR